MQRKNKYVPSMLLVVTILTTFAATFLFPITHVHNVSAVESVNSVGVYWDEECENRVHSLDWGNLSPGSIHKFNLYVRNESNESMILNLLTENWSPLIAAQNISVSWDYHGDPIHENQVIPTELALFVSPAINEVTTFSFDLLIIESESSALSLGEVAGEKILNAPANTVYFIYADPTYMSRAESTYDGTAGETVRNLCVNSQNYGFNTTQHWLLPSGAINTNTIHNATIATFGGRFPNALVNYYETINELTPVKCLINSTHIWFENRTGTILSSLPFSVIAAPNYHEDIFTAMVFYDVDGDNTFFVMYGVDWKATWASGIYFKEVISQNLGAYTNDYYVFRWIDDNEQDGIPQSSEIHQETFG